MKAKDITITAHQQELYTRWRELVNMGPKELANWIEKQLIKARQDSKKYPGLKRSQAKKLGIKSGLQSARWIIKMKNVSKYDWTPEMWRWAGRQVSFISRMKGNPGPLRDDKGEPTRKLLALLVWGHNPEK